MAEIALTPEKASAQQGASPVATGRDYQREARKLRELGVSSGLAMQNPKTFLEAVYKPQELSNIPDYQNLIKQEGQRIEARGGLEKAEISAKPSSLAVLEDALREKVDVGRQRIGESDLFKVVGLTGIENLNQSLNENANLMKDRYGSFVNQLSRVSGVVRDKYETALSRYERLNNEYLEQQKRFDSFSKDFLAQEREIQKIMLEDELLRKQKKEIFTYNSDIVKFVNSYGETKEVPSEISPNIKAWEAGELRSAQTSDLSRAVVITDKDPNGDNCVFYVRAKKPWLPYGQDTIANRAKVVQSFGHKDPSRVKVGDVIITSEGTVGHTAIVTGIEGDNLVLDEANYKAGKVTQGRRINKNDRAIMGFLTDPENAKAEGALENILQKAKQFKTTIFGAPMIEGFDRSREGEAPSIEDQFILGAGQTGSGGAAGSENDIANYLSLGVAIFGSGLSFGEGDKETAKELYKEAKRTGKGVNEVMDTFVGFNLQKNQDIGRVFKDKLLQQNKGLVSFDMRGLARLLNQDDITGATRKFERMAVEEGRKTLPDVFISEANARIVKQKADRIKKIIEELEKVEDNPIGAFSGSFEQWLGRFKSKEAETLKTEATNLIKKDVNTFMGSAMTKNEESFFEGIIPKISDSTDNFVVKINGLESDALDRLNAFRNELSLPSLSGSSLINESERIKLYMDGQEDKATPVTREVEIPQNIRRDQAIKILQENGKATTEENIQKLINASKNA